MGVIVSNLAFLVWAAGLLLYFFSKNTKLEEVGKAMFFVGLFVWLGKH